MVATFSRPGDHVQSLVATEITMTTPTTITINGDLNKVGAMHEGAKRERERAKREREVTIEEKERVSGKCKEWKSGKMTLSPLLLLVTLFILFLLFFFFPSLC